MRRLLAALALTGAAILTPHTAGAQGWTCFAVPGAAGQVWGCHAAVAWGNPPYWAQLNLGGETTSDLITMTAYRTDGTTVWGIADTTVGGPTQSHTIGADVTSIKVALHDFRPSPQATVSCVQTMLRNLGGIGSFGVTGPAVCG